MKKICAVFVFVIMGLIACKNDNATEKVLLDEVISIHDEVMGKEDLLMRNKMKLDTMLMPGALNDKYNAIEKATISAVRFKLIAADEAMSTWMQRFDAELKGKSHEEKMRYYTEQKKAVMRIDSLFTSVIDSSNKYLKELKK